MFGLIGKIVARPGTRDALLAILQIGAGQMPGCVRYDVAADANDADTIWVNEAWESEADHQNSLSLPSVKAAIAQGRPLIAGFERIASTTPASPRGPGRAGVLVYALDLNRLAQFYASVLAMQPRHRTPEMVVLRSADGELLVHQIPPQYAEGITIATPPAPREDGAYKPYYAVRSLEQALATVVALGGLALGGQWENDGLIVRNGCDPEGNIFQLRELRS